MAAAAYIHAAGGLGSGAAAAFSFETASGLAGEAQPLDLRPLATSLGISMPRLASRFAQLAVVGTRICTNRLERPLPPASAVYLASGLGDVARSDALYYQVMPPGGEMASPAQFATSGNNMGAFFVAQQLGLVSRNFTISQQDLSVEHACALALADISDGVTEHALLGGVDETTLPRAFYVRRYPLSEHFRIGEGSAWMVLGRAQHGAIGEVSGVAVVPAMPEGSDACGNEPAAWADRVTATCLSFARPQGGVTLVPGVRLSAAEIAGLSARRPDVTIADYRGLTGCFPTAVALAIAGTCAQKSPSDTNYLHINRDARGRTGILAWRVYGETTSAARAAS